MRAAVAEDTLEKYLNQDALQHLISQEDMKVVEDCVCCICFDGTVLGTE